MSRWEVFDGKKVTCVEVTIENVVDLLLKAKYGLMFKYHVREEDLIGFAIGPNEFLCLQEQLRNIQRIPSLFESYHACVAVAGMKIYCTPRPGILPLFGERAWWIATELSRQNYAEAMDA